MAVRSAQQPSLGAHLGGGVQPGAGAGREQQVEALRVSAQRGELKRRPPVGAEGRGVCAEAQQLAQARGVPALRGEVERGVRALAVGGREERRRCQCAVAHASFLAGSSRRRLDESARQALLCCRRARPGQHLRIETAQTRRGARASSFVLILGEGVRASAFRS